MGKYHKHQSKMKKSEFQFQGRVPIARISKWADFYHAQMDNRTFVPSALL